MNKKELFFHIVKRDALPWYQAEGIRAVAIVLALVLCGILTTITTGIDPIEVYKSIFTGAFGTERKTWITLQNLSILLLIALALTPAFKMKFWNIGGEGQILAGCLAGYQGIEQSLLQFPAGFVVHASEVPAVGFHRYKLFTLRRASSAMYDERTRGALAQ